MCTLANEDDDDAAASSEASRSSAKRMRPHQQRVSLECGRSRFKLLGLPKDEFPAFPAVRFDESWRIKSGDLQKLIQHTSFAVSTEESRPILNGVLWELRPERMRMVATNGHRLARMELPIASTGAPTGDLIVPPKALDQIRRLFPAEEELEIARGDNHLGFRSPFTAVYTRLIEGPYPNYEQVIPKDNDNILIADRDRLVLGIRRMDWLADNPEAEVWLSLRDERLQFGRVHPAVRPLGGLTDHMMVEYQGSSLDIGFRSAYLLGALQHMPAPKVRLRLGGPSAPALIEPDAWAGAARYLMLVTPLRDDGRSARGD
jgi:DNA polymerase-3 subunit beta